MNDLDLVKKVKGAAPINSPEFTGTPTTPTPTGNTSKQVSNVEYVGGQISEVKDLITNQISDLQKKIDNIDSTGVDVDKLKQEIIDALKPSISDDIIKDLNNESVKISFSDLEGNQNSILKQIDAVIEIIDEAIALNMSSYKETLTAYRAELVSKRDQLVSYYNLAKAAYDKCCETNNEANYSDFTQKLKTWDEYTGEVLAYCQSVLNKLSNILLGLKADATQDSIFNLLTNNGEVQGIYFANVTDSDTGKTTRQLFINGEFMQMKGVDVKDLNNVSTFKVTKSGNVSINATEFTLKGKPIGDVVSDAISSDSTIQDSIDKATSGMNTTIGNLSNKVDEIESNMGDVSEEVKEAIKDGAISASEVTTIKKLYNDLSSRQTAVLKEIDAIIALSNISVDDKDLMNNYRTSVVNAFTAVTTAYNAIIQSSSPTTQQFTTFDEKVKSLNEYVGTARAYGQTTLNNITTKITNEKLSADRKAVFNALTDNGKIQGITMVEDATAGAQLYINGEYIQSKDFKAENSVSTPDIYVERINCVRTPTMLEEKATVTINKDDSSADDMAKFADGDVFKTLQGALDACPVFFNGNSIVIKLTHDITEDIEFRGFGGGAIYILMCNHNIYGNIKIRDCHTVEIYGGTNTNENIPDKANRPVISPFQLIEDGESYYTVFAYSTPCVLLRNVNIYGKVAASDSKYTVATKNFAVGAGRGTLLNASNVAIINSDNGFKAVRGGKIISQATEGQCTNYGWYAMYGGILDLCSYTYGSLAAVNKATGGKVKNYAKLDSETINVGPNITFDGITITPDSDKEQSSTTTNQTSTTIKSSSGYSYRLSGSYIGSFTPDMVVREGLYTTSYGKNKGFWFFGNLFDQFKGKNVTKVVFTVTRLNAGTYGASVQMYLRWHTFKDVDIAKAAVSSTSSGPAMSTWVQTFTCKPTGTGTSNTFTIDSSNEGTNGPLAAIKAGTLKGFGIYNSSDNYQGYSATMTVTVYCN